MKLAGRLAAVLVAALLGLALGYGAMTLADSGTYPAEPIDLGPAPTTTVTTAPLEPGGGVGDVDDDDAGDDDDDDDDDGDDDDDDD